MSYFNEDKADKLERLWLLRLMHYAGAVHWKDVNGYAQQHLRLLHPFAWLYLVPMVVLYIFDQGIPRTIKEIKTFLQDESIWW